MMRHSILARLLAAAAACALVPGAIGQSIYLDFGAAGSPFGVPPPTYGGAGPAGVWQGVSAANTTGLLDTSGVPTGVSLTVSAAPMLDACGHAGTTGADEALFDDRWFFDPPFVTLTVAGLQPGLYRVHVHCLVGPCTSMFSPLSATIAGATPATDSLDGHIWSGAPAQGQNHTTQYKQIGAGENLVIQTEAPAGFCCYTQHNGLQIIRVDPPLAYCFGDGTGTPCPCGNAGAAGRGCENSFGTGGALLRMTFGGLPSIAHDSVELSASGMPPTASGLYFQGTTMVNGGAGTTFGDGLRCAGGSVLRLGTKVASAGASSYPGPGDAAVSVRGMLPPAGGTRTYQVWYRNAAGFCTPDVFNLTNALRLAWGP